MKKIAILTAAALLIASSGYSQRKVGFGPKSGMTLAHVTNICVSSVKPSFYVGMFVDYEFNCNFSMELSAIYARQGSYMKIASADVPDASKRYNLKLNYVNFPLVVKWYLAGGFHVFAGPQFGVLTDARWDYRTERSVVTNSFKRFDLSAVTGIGYLAPCGMMITANYNFGLLRIDNDAKNQLRNSVFNIGMGWRF